MNVIMGSESEVAIDGLISELGNEMILVANKKEDQIVYLDSGSEFEEFHYDEEKGMLIIPAVIAKPMIYHYEDYDVLRTAEELELTVPAVKRGVPVTRAHPSVGVVTDQNEILGWVADAKYQDDELQTMLEITDKELIADIRSGKLREVSPGHFSDLDFSASGELNGVHYDATQRNIVVDHVAIVPKGRCNTSDGCGLKLDSEENITERKRGEEEHMEISKAVDKVKVAEKLVEETKNVVESIEKEAGTGEAVLGELKELKDLPSPAVTKIDKALKLVGSIKIEAEKEDTMLENVEGALNDVEEALGGEGKKEEAKEEEDKKKGESSDYPKPPAKDASEELSKSVVEEVVKLREELDTIMNIDKALVVDELCTLQDVKTVEDLSGLSLDELKKDLEMVKSLKKKQISFDDDGANSGDDSIKVAYKKVGGGR